MGVDTIPVYNHVFLTVFSLAAALGLNTTCDQKAFIRCIAPMQGYTEKARVGVSYNATEFQEVCQ